MLYTRLPATPILIINRKYKSKNILKKNTIPMTSFPNSTRLIKGANVGIDIFAPIPTVILFQYNPDHLTRRLQSQMAGDGGAGSESLRLKGAPAETISQDIEIDATDRLEKAESAALSMGISPQLSALEMLIYPKRSLAIANTALLAAGT